MGVDSLGLIVFPRDLLRVLIEHVRENDNIGDFQAPGLDLILSPMF